MRRRRGRSVWNRLRRLSQDAEKGQIAVGVLYESGGTLPILGNLPSCVSNQCASAAICNLDIAQDQPTARDTVISLPRLYLLIT